MKRFRNVIISRTDAIGDVVLTLPVAALVKQLGGEDVNIIFLGRTYTYPVIKNCSKVDSFLNYDTFVTLDEKGKSDFLKNTGADTIIHVFPRHDISVAAKSAGIRTRIGTTNRLHHWFNCNRLVRLSRRNSTLHEAQLNVKLLQPLGHTGEVSLDTLGSLFYLNAQEPLPGNIASLPDKNKFKLILHPKSNASAREWKLENYAGLIRNLPPEKFQVFITGGERESEILNAWHQTLPNHVINLAGKLTLDQLVSFLNVCDGVIAASTGPLHMASALGKHVLGIYPPIKPMDPGRWAPVGKQAEFIVADKKCSDCRFNPAACHCINEITPGMAEQRILKWLR